MINELCSYYITHKVYPKIIKFFFKSKDTRYLKYRRTISQKVQVAVNASDTKVKILYVFIKFVFKMIHVI